MQDSSRRAARLLERAQAGEADTVLAEVTAGLRTPGGDLACMHFVRVVALIVYLPDCPATISIGVAVAPAVALGDALHRADQAMYEAKRAGGDAIRSSLRDPRRHQIHHDTLHPESDPLTRR